MRERANTRRRWWVTRIPAAVLAVAALPGCKTVEEHGHDATAAAAAIVEKQQNEVFGRRTPFVVEPFADTLRRRLLETQNLPVTAPASVSTAELTPVPGFPEAARPAARAAAVGLLGPDSSPLVLSLTDALQIGARNSRDYQTRKEDVFETALGLDLAQDAFRTTFAGIFSSEATVEATPGDTESGVLSGFEVTATRLLRTGASLSGRIAFDLAHLLTSGGESSFGILADPSITVPLLSGSGRRIVTEALTQADRNVLYALYRLERFRRTYAVQIASEYLGVLQEQDRIRNQEENYRRLIASARRARRLGDAGRLPEIDVDEARQDELRARTRWIAARSQYAARLDRFKLTLGLPVDARLELDTMELARLVTDGRTRLGLDAAAAELVRAAPEEDADITLVEPTRDGAGRLELDERTAIAMALRHRLDMRILVDQVEDAQRDVVIRADALRPGLDLVGSAALGSRRQSLSSATSDRAQLRGDDATYSLGVDLDLPWEKTDERNALRSSFLALERAARAVQEFEDEIKLEVRASLRALAQAREDAKIQVQAVRLAERRVRNTDLQLQAGRAQVRDVLLAQESLLGARNALTAALRSYRVAELDLQRDMGVLDVSENGLWQEYMP